LVAALLCACGTKGNCNTTNCAGCCDDQSYCQLNYTASACGKGGSKCAACPTSNTCSDGVCTAFNGAGGGDGTGGGGGGGGATGGGAGTGGGSGGGGMMAGDAGYSRFATMAMNWPVPASGLADGFNFPKGLASVRLWDTFDIDGDGKPDLIHTGNTTTGSVWSSPVNPMPFWKVYKNTGSGFSTTATTWLVPPSGTAEGFNVTQSFAKGKQWATFDIDGDGRPDLVQTANTNDAVFPGPAWRLFKNTGTGFAATATNWPLPATTMLDGYNAKESNASPKVWSTFDLDGDKLPDLVITSVAGAVFDGGTSSEWHLHRNTGTGFSPLSVDWRVPGSGLADGFNQPASAVSVRQWTTMDLDGDGLVDLVQTANPQGGAVFLGATPFWRVYKNTGSAFAAAFTQWPVPVNGLADGFYASEVQTTSRRWTTRDLNGDGRPDLVHTGNVISGQVWGADAGMPYWNVYGNTGAGFVQAPQAFTVPPTGLAEGFNSATSSLSLNRWQTFDLDGDGNDDLVHTGNVVGDAVWSDPQQPAAFWKVYAPRH